MKTEPECISCYFNQLITTGRRCGLDRNQLIQMSIELGTRLSEMDFTRTPAENSPIVMGIIAQHTHSQDNFVDIRRHSIQESLKLYPQLKWIVRQAKDPLKRALLISAVGNTIDFGVPGGFDLKKEIGRIEHLDFAVFDYLQFKKALEDSRSIVILGDNAGETVFDRVLIEELNKPVTYGVRSAPALNDALKEDAEASGLHAVARIVETGATIPSTVSSQLTREFQEIMDGADLVISKGQGNYEGMSGEHRGIFFLLKAKCQVIASELGVQIGDLVLKRV